MTITELIAALEAVKAEHGDLEVVVFKHSMERAPRPQVSAPEWREDCPLEDPPLVLSLN